MTGIEKPIARKNGLVIQEASGEVLVYDLETNKAHCLNESAAIVWKNCDGNNSISDLAGNFAGSLSSDVSEDFVWLAIDQLNEMNLLEKDLNSNFQGQSRRELIKKIGLAAVIALPIVSSLVAPTSVLANTSCTCTANNPATCTPQVPAGCPSCHATELEFVFQLCIHNCRIFYLR